MSPGPPRKPTEQAARSGSWRGKARQKREPKAPAGAPTQPRWLTAEAKQVWRALVDDLEALGVLTKVDGRELARYAMMFARWRRAETFVARHGESYELLDQDGNVKCYAQYPEVAVARQLATALLRIEQEFGLTPAARARLGVAVKHDGGKQDEFFKQ